MSRRRKGRAGSPLHAGRRARSDAPYPRKTMPDTLREIGKNFFAVATSLELTGDKIRRAFAKEKKKLEDVWRTAQQR